MKRYNIPLFLLFSLPFLHHSRGIKIDTGLLRQHHGIEPKDDDSYMSQASAIATSAISSISPSFRCKSNCIDAIVSEARLDMLSPPSEVDIGSAESLSQCAYVAAGTMSFAGIADKAYRALTDSTNNDNGLIKMFFTVFTQGLYYNIDTLYSKYKIHELIRNEWDHIRKFMTNHRILYLVDSV
jgi:hypothetical protein